MQRYAQISNGVVANVIESESDPDGSTGTWIACGLACPGWLFAEWEFSPPPQPAPAAPDTCSPAQGLVALYALKGITETDILAAIALIPDTVDRYTAQVAFARAIEWRRDSASMQQLATLLGLTESDLDALFEFAVTVAV